MTVPILGITRNGPTAAIIEETRSGFWAEPEDADGLCKLLAEHMTRVKHGYEFTPVNAAVMTYHAKNVMCKFLTQVK